VGRELEATLDLLYVDEGTERMYELRDPAVTAVLDREQMSIQDMLDQQLRRLRDSLPEDVRGEALLRRGRATDEILQLARGRDAVLIGTHGRRGGRTCSWARWPSRWSAARPCRCWCCRCADADMPPRTTPR
jgi:nucleotide-binding universal stress UspA family protein